MYLDPVTVNFNPLKVICPTIKSSNTSFTALALPENVKEDKLEV